MGAPGRGRGRARGETEFGTDCRGGVPGRAVKIFPLDAPFPSGKDIRKGGMVGDAQLK